MNPFLKNLIRKGIQALGYDIISKQRLSDLTSFSMEAAIKRCKTRGIKIETVIDVGASNGSWSELCLKHYPNSFYFLVEAQIIHEPQLMQFVKKHPKSAYLISAAGNREGEIYFDAESPVGGLASEIPLDNYCIKTPVTTLDHIVSSNRLKPPYLIKLDTHGYEIPILEGARNTLNHTHAVIMETYNFKVAHDSLRFFEMCDYMKKTGFLPIDIVDLLHRKFDQALWQMDLFFIPSTRHEFSYNSYE
ncbi:MAG: FkbM family methyltransferase [Candidatus Aureabacteria bacterium]|nr:FkbM family methyltransferase [Candidatus Auribacterota bacterium]